VGTVFFPLDEALGLLPGQCTPRLYEGLVLLSAWMPFGQAVSKLATLLGVDQQGERGTCDGDGWCGVCGAADSRDGALGASDAACTCRCGLHGGQWRRCHCPLCL
jgi:hypothetical protein